MLSALLLSAAISGQYTVGIWRPLAILPPAIPVEVTVLPVVTYTSSSIYTYHRGFHPIRSVGRRLFGHCR